MNFVERIAERDLGRDLGDRIAGRLGGERRRARNARIDLDDRVVEALGIERKLTVAAADDAERRDDVERGAAEHLILLVRQRERRSDDDAVARVDPDRIEVLHTADGDDVAARVAHGLKFDLFPAVDILLHQDLRDRRSVEPRFCDGQKFFLGIGDAAARAAERKGGAHDDRIADFFGNGKRATDVVCDIRGDGRLADLLHGRLEQFSVLGFVDRVGVRADQADVVFRKKALFVELHGDREPRLSAERGEQTIRLFFLNDALDRLDGQRLEVDLVGKRVIGHDRGGIGIDQHHVDARRAKHAARLRAGVVEFGRLPDDDRSGADDHDFFDRFVQRHQSTSIMLIKRSNRKAVSCGPAHASGWNCTEKARRSG